MKSLRLVLLTALLGLVPIAFSQSAAHQHDTSKSPAPPSEAQKSFDKLKSLAGSWEGKVETDVPMEHDQHGDGIMHVTLRVTSRGNALMHEMRSSDSPDDPITMLYLDGEKLFLTHYCDAGNRPRMTGKASPDGKKVEFDFVDVVGKNTAMHMQHAVFIFVDENHHTEDWTFQMGDKPIHAHIDLQRSASNSTNTGAVSK